MSVCFVLIVVDKEGELNRVSKILPTDKSRGYRNGCERTARPASLGSLAANNLHSLVNVLTKLNGLETFVRDAVARNLNALCVRTIGC